MSRLLALGLFLPLVYSASAANGTEARRVFILKVDGLNADLLYGTMRQTDPASGKSRLPWLSHIFAENGAIFENFYTRGISLSAPSWSMLDTGQHTIIRGNVEYDRYTGRVYDYLNFFPFYIGNARKHQVDMPGVEVLDRAGIPLLVDAFPYRQRFQSFQLFQRGVRWSTLKHVLERRFSSKVLFSMIESAGTPSLDEMLAQQTENEVKNDLKQPEIFYLDFYTGDIDHEGHATNQPAALLDSLRRLDALAGRIWTAIQASPLASETLFVVVSDHGMNNVPGVFSQGFSLPDLFNSPQGGGHHVITNRHQLSDYKLMGLNPLVQRVVTPSTASFYLSGEADRYPTAWLDVDGNERASVQLRNSDLNEIHILLLQLSRPDLSPNVRNAAALCVREIVDRHRAIWTKVLAEVGEELRTLQDAIGQREQRADKTDRRQAQELQAWQHERADYSSYLAHLSALLALQPDTEHPFHRKISDFVPELALGDGNTVRNLQNYVVGLSAVGLVGDASGKLDESSSFHRVNYFSLFAQQRARNNPQAALSARPIDFTAMRLPDGASAEHSEDPQHAYWLYGDDDHQLVILVNAAGLMALRPVQRLSEDGEGKVTWTAQEWRAGLPLHLFEDANLHVPENADRAGWLSGWHSERQWLEATHLCQYSNGVIGVTEELSPVGENVPGRPGISPILLRYERRRRELVQPDFEIFAADHWNFNVRNFNPGGNHGAFFRISTHSVWMMAGSGIATEIINEPYDSLEFRLHGFEHSGPNAAYARSRRGIAIAGLLSDVGVEDSGLDCSAVLHLHKNPIRPGRWKSIRKAHLVWQSAVHIHSGHIHSGYMGGGVLRLVLSEHERGH